MVDPADLNKRRKKIEGENDQFYRRLKKKTPSGFEDELRQLDSEVFSRTDCLSCANCCKTISTVFKERDITRISNHFKIRPAEFVSRYLYLDNDGDYVVQKIPCPFLLDDNKCSIYEIRPAACRSYPHTSTLPIKKSWNLLAKNSAVCPAVYEITTLLQKKYQK